MSQETTYVKVRWRHNFGDEPVLLYSELDEGRWETRKVEVYSNGRVEFAGPAGLGKDILSETPIPSLSKIAEDPQFLPEEIDREEFERVWQRAVAGEGTGKS